MSGLPLSAFIRVSTILKLPGVSVIAKAIQNPPYEDNAVAPNVLPIAISLILRVRNKSDLNSLESKEESHTTCPPAAGRCHHNQKPIQ